MTITKSIEFFAPYVATTFNTKDAKLAQCNGMLTGGTVTIVTSTTVSISPYTFLQDGIVVTQDAVTTPITVPEFDPILGGPPIHIVISSPNAKNSSGVSISVVTGNSGLTSSNVLVATRINGLWQYPQRLSYKDIIATGTETRSDVFTGRIDGAETTFDYGYGTGGTQCVRVTTGEVNEPDGTKHELDARSKYNTIGLGNYVQLPVINTDPDFYRTDYAVLRKRGLGPAELCLVKGPTMSPGATKASASVAGSVTVDAAAGNTAPSVTDNAAGAHVCVWGNGVNLHLGRLDHSIVRIVTDTSSLAIGATVKDVYITRKPTTASGDRLYGVLSAGAVGSEEIYVFRTDADGSALVSAHCITSMTNGARKPHMVIDDNGIAYIVFQHNESAGGSPNNQVYYVKYNLNDSVFGTAAAIAVSPRLAAGSNSGYNDTAPRLALDSSGYVHIIWVKGTTNHTYGDITYLVISQSGRTYEAKTTISTDPIGKDGAPFTDNADNADPKIVCTVHGTIYAGWVADSSTTTPSVILYTRDLKTRIEYTSIQADAIMVTGAVDCVIPWWNLIPDDLGRIGFFAAARNAADSARAYFYYRYKPIIVSDNNTITPDMLCRDTANVYVELTGNVAGQTTGNGSVNLDVDGSIQMTYLIGNTVYHDKFSSQACTSTYSVDTNELHQNDTVLGAYAIPVGNPSNIISCQAESLNHRKRISTKPPITAVGLDGDYMGFQGIQDAILSLRGKGGKVIVRGGYHRIINPITLMSGIELIADGNTVLDCANASGASITSSGYVCSFISTTIVAHRIYALDWGTDNPIMLGYKPGDMVIVYDNSLTLPFWPNPGSPDAYRITFIVKMYYSSGIFHVVLNDDVSAFITGCADPRAVVFASGTKLEGFTICDQRASKATSPITITNTYRSVFKDLNINTTCTDPTVIQTGCWNALWDSCNMSGPFTLAGTAVTCDVASTLSNCRFSGDVNIGVANGTSQLKITGCDIPTPTKTWTFGANNEGLVWLNNGGEVSNPDAVFDAYSDLGRNNTIAFSNAQARQTRVVPMLTTHKGHVLDATHVNAPYRFDSYSLGSIVNSDGLTVSRTEPTGRIAEPNRFFDDFAYFFSGAGSDKWIEGGVIHADKVPRYYGVSSDGAIDAYPYSTIANAGGALYIVVPDGKLFTMGGSQTWCINPAGNRSVLIYARVAFVTDHCAFALGAKAASYDAAWSYTPTLDTHLMYGVNDGVAPYVPVASSVVVAPSTFYNLYIMLKLGSIDFWATGMAAPASVPTGGGGAQPRDITSVDVWQLALSFGNAANPAQQSMFLDAWEIRLTTPLGG